MSMYDIMDTVETEYLDDDPEWVRFVQDHRRFLIENSSTVTMTNDEWFRYEFRPEDILTELGVPRSALWIFLWVNQIQDVSHFPQIKELYVPVVPYLTSLKSDYRTFSAQLNK